MISSALRLVAGKGAPASKVAKSVLDIAGEAVGRRARPTDADTIVRNIKRRLPEIRNRPEGFTYDPVRDRFLSNKEGDVGIMMATRPEVKIGNRNVNEAKSLTPSEIDRMFRENPQMLEDLRRGALFGGYDSPGRGFILDASRRFGSTRRAQGAGYRSGQDEGFNLADFSAVKPRPGRDPSLAALALLAGDTED